VERIAVLLLLHPNPAKDNYVCKNMSQEKTSNLLINGTFFYTCAARM